MPDTHPFENLARHRPQADPPEGDDLPVQVAPTGQADSAGQPQMRVPDELDILPTRDAVAFPGTVLPFDIGREKSKRLVADVLSGHKIIGVVAQRSADIEDPGLDDLYRVGTACLVLKLLKLSEGRQTIIVHGLVRFGVERLIQEEPFLKARIVARPDEAVESTELDALVHSVRTAAGRLIEMSPNVPDEAAGVLNSITRPGALTDFISANLPVDLVQKQELLETFDVLERLRKVNAALANQVEILELSQKIQTQVKDSIDKSQRQFFLQEQLKAIQKELGQSDARGAEVEELREKVAAAKMPQHVAAEAERELQRLERIPQASPEYSVARDYVEWLCDMPWAKSTRDRLDIKRAEKVLNQDHYGLHKIKRRILEYLAVRKLNPTGRGPILCFSGPPGVGKTSLGQSIARALGRKFIRISLGGVRDEADIRGHRRTYIGALPGRIMQELRKAESHNPVFMLDEVDKLGADFRGDPASALLEVLDPEQNHSFTDRYLDVPFDLSKVMFIGTANYIEPVIPALRDRMEVIALPGYTLGEKTHIATDYLVPRQMKANGLKPSHVTFPTRAIETLINDYTREAGVRNLERQIGAICRAVAARVATGQTRKLTVTPKRIEEFLGPRQFESEVSQRTSVPGVATGLAFTPTGGEIIFIEATHMPGKGTLILTGQIGDVMKESAQAAFSLVRSNAPNWDVDVANFAQRDIHIHVPAGAIPKDGPSAGVSMLTALASLVLGRPVRHDVAMTGEITLRGLILPVGGIKEKVLAARRAGIRTILLPRRNEKDLVDVPDQIRKGLSFVFVDKADDVLNAALEPEKKQRTRKKKSSASRRKTKRKTKTRGTRTASATKPRSKTAAAAR